MVTAKPHKQAKEQEHQALGHSYHSTAAPGRNTIPGKQSPPDTDRYLSKTKSSFLSSLESRDPKDQSFSFFSASNYPLEVLGDVKLHLLTGRTTLIA